MVQRHWVMVTAHSRISKSSTIAEEVLREGEAARGEAASAVEARGRAGAGDARGGQALARTADGEEDG